MFPPYVTAGGYILSKSAVQDFYYASYFVKRFKFDDVYVGLIAKKVDIEPFHCEEFHFYHKPYTIPGYRYVVASHGYSDPNLLEQVWNKQKELFWSSEVCERSELSLQKSKWRFEAICLTYLPKRIPNLLRHPLRRTVNIF